MSEDAGAEEVGVVAVVAEVVEGFARVFDGDFGADGVGEEGAEHGVVEVGTVGMGLMWG